MRGIRSQSLKDRFRGREVENAAEADREEDKSASEVTKRFHRSRLSRRRNSRQEFQSEVQVDTGIVSVQ